HGKPFNFYPRGRVEIKNGKVTVYLNPSLNTDTIRSLIISEFELADMPDITFKSDGSKHYGFVSFFG
ncbi:MAG: hypothetical protein KBS45_05650, partial [Clostridiales bacterium]|nr:hypothetical protein [Candidatus Coliplasma caballi]